jgi:hypothetical protein
VDRFLAIAISNREAFAPCMDVVETALAALSGTERRACGVGEQGADGEPLLQQRPLAPGQAADAFQHLQSGGFALVQTSRLAEDAVFRSQQTPPFKDKRWLWTLAGDLQEREDSINPPLAIPDFLQARRRGTHPGEVSFLQFLAFLHSFGNLRREAVPLSPIERALESTLSLIPTRYEGGPFLAAAAEQRVMLIQSHGMPLWIRALGEEDTTAAPDETLRIPTGFRPGRALAVTNVPPDGSEWRALSPHCRIIVDRIGQTRITPTAASDNPRN